ncbi:MAG: hypothetical protein ABSG57_13825 [Candidatus Bathyarchaeia archaeon]|jgi:hypothetical protein
MKREMTANLKLNEAGYFLRAIKNTTDDTFLFNLSAFLSAWRSILDVMLFDFAQKYHLGFGPEDHVTFETFRIVAKALKRGQALRFLSWWRKQERRVSGNPLYPKRNMIVHRKYPETGLAIVYPEEATPLIQEVVGDERRVKVWFIEDKGETKLLLTPVKEGRELYDAIIRRQAQSGPAIVGGKTETRFEDIEGHSVEEVCQEGFEKMKQIVRTAERDFWRKRDRQKRKRRGASLATR